MESCLSDMDASLFDKYLRLCSVTAAIGLSLRRPTNIELSPVGAAEGCDLLTFNLLEGAEDRKIAAFGSSYRCSVGFDKAAAVRQSARPLIKPIPLSVDGARRLPAGLFSLAQR
jgi:hypothetical protein